MEYTSKLPTTTNMIPVMASTNMDKSKIDLAGVVSGAKMFVRPVDEAEGAAPAAVAVNQKRSAIIGNAPSVIEFFKQPPRSWPQLCCDESRLPY